MDDILKPLTLEEKKSSKEMEFAEKNNEQKYKPLVPVPQDALPFDQGAYRYHSKKYGCEPSRIYPYHTADGVLVGYVVRWDFKGAGGKPEKETRPFIYTCDQGKNKWVSQWFPYPHVLYNMKELLLRKEAPVLVCEGEKTVDVAKALFPDWVVVTSARGAKSPKYSDWSLLEGRDVIISPDHDEAGRLYGNAVCAIIRRHGVKSVKRFRIEDLAPLCITEGNIVKRSTLSDVEEDIDLEGYDLADAPKYGWTREILERERFQFIEEYPLLQKTEESSAFRKEKIPENLLPIGTNSDVDLAKHLLRSTLHSEYGRVIYDESAYWRYSETHWKEINHETLCWLLHEYNGKFMLDHEDKYQVLKMGYTKVKNVLECLKVQALGKEGKTQEFFHSPDARLYGINCLDGFIQIDIEGNINISPHSSEHRQRFVIPFHFKRSLLSDGGLINWDAEPWNNSLLKKLLFGCFKDDIDRGDKIRLMTELFGVTASVYALKLRQPLMMLFLGESAENGKSQLLDVIKGLHSAMDVCSVDPENFSNEHYRLQLKNKKLNIVYELSGNALVSDKTKQITTGDVVIGRELYKNPVEFRCHAQHIFATNKLPSFFGGMDRGLQRRLAVLTFNRVIPKEEKIVNIGERIVKEEGHLLLAMAVSGFMSIVMNGDYTLPQSSLAAMEEWKGEADPVLGFMQECVELSSEKQYVSTQDVYNHFVEWAKRGGLRSDKIPALKGFGRRFKNNIPNGVIDKRTGKSRGFIGLKLIPFGEDHSQNDNVVHFTPKYNRF